MTDLLRDQVNTARRAGYSDDEIAAYLKAKDPRVEKALGSGYSPTEIMDFLAPPLTTGEEVARKTGVAARGATEALAPVTAGALGGAALGAMTGVAAPIAVPVGALAGGLAVPTADVLVQGYNKLAGGNVRLPSQVISDMIPGPRAETPVERVIQSSTGALGGTGGSVAAGRAITQVPQVLMKDQIIGNLKTRPSASFVTQPIAPEITAIGREAARAPVGQIVTAPIATGVGQTVTEATDNPLAGLAASVATGAVAGARPTKREQAPSSEQLLAQSKANYELLDKSGFQLDSNQFKQHMSTLPAKLRAQEGYVESVNPKIAGAFKELLNDSPKDVAEITALRKIIGNAAGSADRQERKIASKLLDEFDDYVLNAPPSAVVGGDKSAIDAWKAARADYAKVKKAELIDDIVSRAEVSQSGKETSIAQGLSALAKDKKKMRFFSPDEQEAIRDAAKGGPLQATLRTLAKFTPMTPAAAIFTAVNPFGAYTAAAGMASKELATARRMQQVDRLTNQMRLGRQPQVIEGAFANEPVFFSRNALGMMGPVQQQQQQNQNALVGR